MAISDAGIPLALAVLVMAAALVLGRQGLNLMHLVDMRSTLIIGSDCPGSTSGRVDDRPIEPWASGSFLGVSLDAPTGLGVLATSAPPVLQATRPILAPGVLPALRFPAVLAAPKAGNPEPLRPLSREVRN